jgi:hypothetical protein
MNDRIEELIVAYLHRGSSPEQERELFDACRTNPDVASLLRQHITLSLKLRMLREKTEVPQEVHNALLRRINEMKVESPSVEKARWSWIPDGFRRVRFGWSHLTGTALATGLAVLALFFFTRTDTVPTSGLNGTTASTAGADTVLLTRVDTVYQTRTLSKPVYIVRYEKRAPEQNPTPSPLPADAPSTDVAQAPRVPVNIEPPAIRPANDAQPSIAQIMPIETPSYLQQYTTMVTSLEKVRLSSTDRVRE